MLFVFDSTNQVTVGKDSDYVLYYVVGMLSITSLRAVSFIQSVLC